MRKGLSIDVFLHLPRGNASVRWHSGDYVIILICTSILYKVYCAQALCRFVFYISRCVQNIYDFINIFNIFD